MRTIVTGGSVLVHAGEAGRQAALDLWIEDGRIAHILPHGASATSGEGWADAERIDASGLLVAPGLVNAHTHSPLASLRGTTDGLDHVGFMWRNQADTAGRSSQEIYAHAHAQALEALASGTTALVDHFPEQNPTREGIDAVASAYRDVGIRATIALRVFDASYDDILPRAESGIAMPAGEMPLAPASIDDLVSLCEDVVSRWHGAEGRIAIMPAPSNPLRCSDDLLRACANLAERHDLGLHTHMLETEVQRRISRDRHGVSNIAHLDRLGILSDRWSLAHCVWVDEDDLAALAASGGTPVHNPASNAKLAVGTAPVAKMLRLGIPVGLGTDGASTSDTLDMHEAAWLAVLLSRATGEGLSSEEGYALATTGGTGAVRQPHMRAAIEEGATADLVFYDLGDVALGPLNDPVQQIVFSARGVAVAKTMVAGRVVYEADAKFAARRRAAAAKLAETRAASRARNAGWSLFAEAMARR